MKILIQRRRSYIVPLLVILVFSASGTTGWKYIKNQQVQHTAKINALIADRLQLLEDYRLLLEDKRQAELKVDMLNQSGQVDALAYAKVNEHLKTLQKDVIDLTEEVTFYRDIVANSSTGSVNIKHFGVRANDEAGSFQYRLVLTRGTRSDKVVQGTVNLAIEGVLKGRKKRLELKNLGAPKANALVYQFKYFQRFEGRFLLPDNFNPQRIIVNVTAAGNSNRPLRKSFDWAATIS